MLKFDLNIVEYGSGLQIHIFHRWQDPAQMHFVPVPLNGSKFFRMSQVEGDNGEVSPASAAKDLIRLIS